jgi:hypothetical protein
MLQDSKACHGVHGLIRDLPSVVQVEDSQLHPFCIGRGQSVPQVFEFRPGNIDPPELIEMGQHGSDEFTPAEAYIQERTTCRRGPEHPGSEFMPVRPEATAQSRHQAATAHRCGLFSLALLAPGILIELSEIHQRLRLPRAVNAPHWGNGKMVGHLSRRDRPDVIWALSRPQPASRQY